jgi:hypothetical protein
MINTFSFASYIASIAIALSIVAIFYKIYKIHILTYKILDDTTATRKECAALFDQIQALLALERLLKLDTNLPPMRGWAGSPDFLLHTAKHLLAEKPLTVAECSSGVSTVVAARCMQINGKGHVYSLEHDAEYAQKTRQLLLSYGLEAWATVCIAPLTPTSGQGNQTWYAETEIPEEMTSIQVLLVDGPPAGGDSTARYPALPRLLSRMAPKFSVMLDDADRPGEKEIIHRWLQEIPGLSEKRFFCEKGLAVVSRNAIT